MKSRPLAQVRPLDLLRGAVMALGISGSICAALLTPEAVGSVHIGAINMTAEAGAVLEIPIGLVTEDEITSLQLDLLYNADRLTVGSALTGAAAEGHRIDSAAMAAGVSRVVLYSTTLSPLSGGYIIRIPVSWISDGISEIVLSAIQLVGPTGEPVAWTSQDLTPRIASTPLANFISADGSSTFAVQANGLEPLTYQWYFNGEVISGAVNSTLIIPNASEVNFGTYFATISNPAGSTTSNSVQLVDHLEYAFGIDDLGASSNMLPSLILSDGLLRLTFFRAKEEILYVVEASNNLTKTDWVPIATNPGSVGNFVEVVEPLPLNGTPQFMRLKLIVTEGEKEE